MSSTAVFTIASENYFAQVQTLLKSLQETNPGWDRYFAVADEADQDITEALKETQTHLIRMEELDISDLNDMKFRYDIMELNTAIKPFVMLKLLKQYERVVYLDPDIKVYAEMIEVNKGLDSYNFVVIPHYTGYFADDGKHPDEPDIMRAGIYNFGFFAVKRSEESILAVKWWSKRLETLCINKQKEGIFVDQKWMDLLPGRHQVCILRHNGYNVAYWNLSHRKAECRNGRYYFNGEELVFFHFSGFNPQKTDQISKHQTRYHMKDIGEVKKLFEEYSTETLENQFERWKNKKYAYNEFTDGRAITRVFRILYRENSDIENMVRGKNPFTCSEVFYDQKEKLTPALINYIIKDDENIGVFMINSTRSQWVQWFHERLRDLQMDKEWIDYATNFFAAHQAGFANDRIILDKKYMNMMKKERKELADGINLIGYIRSEHGVGEACRLTASALSTTEIPWQAYDWEEGNPSRKNERNWDNYISETIKYDISIFNINADQLPIARQKLPREAWEGYRIGIWYWELTKFPDQWKNAFNLVDEIWAPTKYIQENISRISPVPVIYMPPGIRRDDPKEIYTREYYKLPPKAFLFLNFFDVYSYTSRKNPSAAVVAFQTAFRPDDMTVGLVLKINNASVKDENIVKLKELISNYQNIYIIAKTMTRDEINGLINSCDVSVSLHRSEGLGLLCEESMYFGKPVIATNWSGNTDFMTKENSCLVDYKLIPIGEYYGTNDPDQVWADPSVDHASEYMQRLKNDEVYYRQVSENARNDIRDRFSPEICGRRMECRIKEILSNKENWTKNQSQQQEKCKDISMAISTNWIDEIRNDISTINTLWDIRLYQELNGNPLKRFIKKAIRKMTKFMLQPLTEQQQQFNAAMVRIVNKLLSRAEIQEEAINNSLTDVITGIQRQSESLADIKTSTQRQSESLADIKTSTQRQSESLADIKTSTQRQSQSMADITAGFQELNNQYTATANMSEHYYQASGSLYNAIYHRLGSLEKSILNNNSNQHEILKRELIENKWKLIDKYYQEPQTMECCICGNTVKTASAEQLLSEDIYGGGKLLRYRCEHCGAIIGPNKMWDLSEKELSEEYKYHYEVNDEGNATEAEIETFMLLQPEKGKKYLNYGCGAWASTIETLRNQGYDVYGYDPYAPCNSEYIITDYDTLLKYRFDGVFSHDLLEHLRYPFDTFILFGKLLTEEGKMAHSTACYRYVYEYDRFHLVFYTGDAVNQLCARTGFVVKEKKEDIDRLQFTYVFTKDK